MNKLRFLGVFLAGFAVLLTLWSVSPLSEAYTAAVLRIAGALGPLLHGWVLLDPEPGTAHARWVSGLRIVDLRIHFDALAIGVVPLWALLLATPGFRLRRRLRALALGTAGCLAIDVLIVALFPVLVHYENAWTGIGGTFLGLIGFVGAPVILWFALSYREVMGWLPSLRKTNGGRPEADPRGSRS